MVTKARRRAMVATGTLALALGAGHLVQNGLGGAPATRAGTPAPPTLTAVIDRREPVPQAIVPLAATAEPALPPPRAEIDNPTLPAPAPPPAVLAAPAMPLPQPAEPDCTARLSLTALPGAMVGLSLTAPCDPAARVVLRHAGLAVTGRTADDGALFAVLPALVSPAGMTARLPDGTEVSATVALRDMDGLRRLAVQWMGDDAFQLHAFEGGADYGQPGHVSAADPGRPAADPSAGYLTLLGDARVDAPLLAEVYTFPRGAEVLVTVEAAVTPATCGREILGETIYTDGSAPQRAELILAMPDCTAVGEFLVLPNPLPDLTLALAE